MVPTVLTGCFGGYDIPKQIVPQSADCRWLIVTDTPDLAADGWEITTVPATGQHPRTAAKLPKLRPWEFADGPWIWIDASMQVQSSTFVEEALAATGGPLGQWAHPDRGCVTTEATASAPLLKYAGVPVVEQAANYIDSGHPENWGLWATGLIVYQWRLDALADAWQSEIDRWGYQDQISQPYALRNNGLRPVGLPHHLRHNPWIVIHRHRDGT